MVVFELIVAILDWDPCVQGKDWTGLAWRGEIEIHSPLHCAESRGDSNTISRTYISHYANIFHD